MTLKLGLVIGYSRAELSLPMDTIIEAERLGFDSVWKQLGYERRSPDELGVQAWEDAALESMPQGSALFFKQLRTDRVLRPI